MATQPQAKFYSSLPADSTFSKWFKRTTTFQRDRFINLYNMIEKQPITLEELKYNRKFERAADTIVLAITHTLYQDNLATHLTHLEDDLADLGITKGQMIAILQKHKLLKN